MYEYVPICEYMYPSVAGFIMWIDRQCVRELRRYRKVYYKITTKLRQRIIGANSRVYSVQFNKRLSTINWVSRHRGVCLSPTPACPGRHNHVLSVCHHGTAPVHCAP